MTKQAVRHRVAPEAEAWFLDYAAMQEAAGLRGASRSHGTKPCLLLMCLGPGIGRPTAGCSRRVCSHWAPHQSATSCMEPCRCHCPWPSSTDCTFCRRHCLYLAGGARQDGSREYKLSLTGTKRFLTTTGLFLPQEQRAASEGALREGGRGPDANKTEAEAGAGFESSTK